MPINHGPEMFTHPGSVANIVADIGHVNSFQVREQLTMHLTPATRNNDTWAQEIDLLAQAEAQRRTTCYQQVVEKLSVRCD